MTFDIEAQHHTGVEYGWKQYAELFCVCRVCERASVFLVSQKGPEVHAELFSNARMVSMHGAINDLVETYGPLTIKDMARYKAPDHVPADIKAAFNEGATCMATQCPNAAATMFRMCLDMATRPFLPAGEVAGLNSKTRRDLGLRLPWLFDNNKLAADLRDLSHCVKEDGNDGAHAGTLTMDDAEDLKDFTIALLERIYTEPARIEAAKKRREERRAPK